MRTFDFLYNADGKIAEGKEVVYYPTDNWYDEPKIVTLAGYDPYYTDGSPDPKNADECEGWCQIEVCGDVDRYDLKICMNSKSMMEKQVFCTLVRRLRLSEHLNTLRAKQSMPSKLVMM